ncbi:alpha/beta fold hydrolase [Paractinoplanes deccanensis]|uniref:alpha/beta fold hydrolase n=1 Tax=Paractinoplanes deccanensis TaxID=113561 RepID=UPI001EF27F2B|nr:alpha/beta hydrolase [Actinoplanes deccanensis]
MDVEVFGAGPTVLLPMSTAVTPEPQASQMRAWGAEPDTGHLLATGLASAGFRVVAADYEGHRARHPAPGTLTTDAVAADLLALAGSDDFAYYGYSWLALAGLQLAIRTDRMTALVMGGYPPLGGPYAEMLAVTRAAHRMAGSPPPEQEVTPGDWDSVGVTASPEQTAQYVTLYESLMSFDERAALEKLHIPRTAFAGADDNIQYGPKWGDIRVPIADRLAANSASLKALGWDVVLIPDVDHMAGMRPGIVLPLLREKFFTLR